MQELLEKILRIDEDSRGLRALHRIYREQERGLDPNPSDLFVALSMLEEYYKNYLDLDLYSKHGGKNLPVHQDYQKRLGEIRKALKGTDNAEQMIALDNAVNQWHIDFPVMMHLSMDIRGEEDEDELLDLIMDINDMLSALGRLPEESPYRKDIPD